MEWFLSEDWKEVRTIATYGFGRVAKANIDMIIEDFSVKAIIDNAGEFENQNYRDIPILNYVEYKKKNCNVKIVVTATGRALKSIRESLTHDGLIWNKDFTDLSTFVNEWYLRFRNQLNLGRIAHPITQRCTLKCKDCQLLMPYINNPIDDEYEIIKRDIDNFFSLVDYVADYDIIGGEPLLYPRLCEHVKYISENYGKQIGNLQIITNATIKPSKEVLDTLKKYNIHVRISDYSNIVPYKKRVDEVIELLQEKGIRYTLFKEMKWTDFGYPYQTPCIGDSEEELHEHMIECNGGMSRLMHNGKIYFCNPAGGAYEAGICEIQDGDALEIEPLLDDRDEGRRKLQLYCMGIMKHGGMSICKNCYGYCGGDEVVAAIQVK